ncbi:MAG TPA: hypothetical protein VJV75_10220, partial [Candidatus Polarisedimenticolia bacterium]|nr:hypothetical protein [Candidatus Polarisedimenticolia bacterium]
LLVAIASGRNFVLPFLATAVIYPVFAALLLEGRARAATVAALLWAATLSASIIAATAHDPERLAPIVLNGPAYRDEMLPFVATGVGRESDPARFIPQHLLHLAAFIGLALASAGLLGLMLGAVLVGYMSFYVGVLASGPEPILGSLCGWPPYAVIRVIAYVILGTVLARPLLGRLAGRSLAPIATGRWVAIAAALLLADLGVKALVAARWAALLRPCLGGAP